ncbi:MAG: TonB-dependent receptor [Marinilabiliaceae bacterium]|nr:TonB-dependent receptor [Marinilabiliaceae bacterium]
MKRYIVFLLSAVAIGASAQNMCGYVSDAHTGERLPQALVYNASNKSTALTNAYGYYSLAQTSKGDTIVARFVGYVTKKIVVNNASKTDISLVPDNRQIGEVEVRGESAFRRELQQPQMSHHHISAAQIKTNAVMFGEADALKTIQLMPGVNSAADGSTNLSVRGGSYDQNLILLDEATVYNPSHTMGIFTAFNADAMSGVDLYKGDLPARYGGKLSAVVDMKMREGNNQHSTLQGGIGTIASRLLVEGPLKKDTASFMIAGRVGYSELMMGLLSAMYNTDTFCRVAQEAYERHEDDKIHFFDLCAKVNWVKDENNKFYISGYASQDGFVCPILSIRTKQNWGNQTGTVRWNHIYSSNLFGNATLTFSNYKYVQRQTEDVRNFEWKSGMREFTLKNDLDYYRNRMHITMGAAAEMHFYNPGQIEPLSGSVMHEMRMDKKRALQLSAYVGNEQKITDRVTLSYGLRMSSSIQLGPATVRHYTTMPYYADSTVYGRGRAVKSYWRVEPRLAASYSLNENATLKASYARTVQYQHLLNNSALGMPTDIWTPADSYIRPQEADAFAVGVHKYFSEKQIEASIEGYYKAMHHIIDFRDNAEFTANEHIETEVLSGKGRAWGLEAMLRRDGKRGSVLLSYTLSKAERKIDGVNQGNWYYAVYDQRHNLAINGMYKLSDRWTLSGTWRYHTGGRATMPINSYYYKFASVLVYSERNGYKMPDFHRLDVSAIYDFKRNAGRRWKSQLVFSLYNVYGRKNAYSVFTRSLMPELHSTQNSGIRQLKGYIMYLYQWVPSITYNFTF